MNRVEYAATTLKAAAHLLSSCRSEQQAGAIMDRMTDMLNSVWTFEFKQLRRSFPPESMGVAVRQYWDQVCFAVGTQDAIYHVNIIHGEEVNPPGQEGNVHIAIQPKGRADMFLTKLVLVDLTK
jgi:hypothetical protein